METKEINLAFYFGVLKDRWKAILASVLIASGLALAYCQLAERSYLGKAALLPEEGGEPALSGALGMLGANFGLGGGSKGKNSDLYLDVVKSRGFIQRLRQQKYKTSKGDSLSLDSVYHLGKYDEAIRLDALSKRFGDALKVVKSESGIVNLQLETNDPVLSAELLTAILRDLEAFFKDRDARKMEKGLEFIKEKLDEKEVQYRQSADKVAAFLSQNQYIDPIKTPRLYTTLEALKTDQRIHEEVYLLLYKEFEQSRIEKQKEKSVMQVLDYPMPALEKERPKRRKIMMGAVAGSFLLSYLALLALARLRKTA
jgi:uncharacterized protein involved in exopolysaccharide biosynthesis